MPDTAPAGLEVCDLRRALPAGQPPAWAAPSSDSTLLGVACELAFRGHPESWTSGHRDVNNVLFSARLQRDTPRGAQWAQVTLGFGHMLGGWQFCGLDFHPHADDPDRLIAGGFVHATGSLDEALGEANRALDARLAEGFAAVDAGPVRFDRRAFTRAVWAHPRRRPAIP